VVGPAERSARVRRRRSRLAAAGFVALVGLGLFSVVVFRVVLTQNQFRLDRMRSDATTEQSRYQRLRLQVAELESPSRIVAAAEQKLGMVQPPSVVYLAPVQPAVTPPAGQGDQGSAAATSTTSTADTDSRADTQAGWSAVKPELAARP
jgi:cell division protein FtsL